MSITGTELEKVCKYLLQKDISLEINNKIIKKGKLIIFYQKNFYLTFIINNDKKSNIKVEIPIPFNVECHLDDNLIYFDYRIKTLSKQAPEIESNLLVYPQKLTGNKFWNNIMTIYAN
jgi:hypothetical protein